MTRPSNAVLNKSMVSLAVLQVASFCWNHWSTRLNVWQYLEKDNSRALVTDGNFVSYFFFF